MAKTVAAVSLLKHLRPVLIGAALVFVIGMLLIGSLLGAAAGAVLHAEEAPAPSASSNVVVGTCAPKCPGVNGPQTGLSVKRALAMAQSEVGRYFPTGWNQEGECIKSVQRWINHSGGRFTAGGVVGGYVASPAVRVLDGSLRPGDVVQFENMLTPDSFLYGVHTYMVLAVHEDGTHDIIESNYNFDGRVGVRLNQPFLPPAGFQAVVWRFAAEPDT